MSHHKGNKKPKGKGVTSPVVTSSPEAAAERLEEMQREAKYKDMESQFRTSYPIVEGGTYYTDGRPTDASAEEWAALSGGARKRYRDEVIDVQATIVDPVGRPVPFHAPAEPEDAPEHGSGGDPGDVQRSPRQMNVVRPRSHEPADNRFGNESPHEEKVTNEENAFFQIFTKSITQFSQMSACKVSIDKRLEVFLGKNGLVMDDKGVTTYAICMMMIETAVRWGNNKTKIAAFSDYKTDVAHSFSGSYLLDFEQKRDKRPIDSSPPDYTGNGSALSPADLAGFKGPLKTWFLEYFHSDVNWTHAYGLLGAFQVRDLKQGNIDNFQVFEEIKFAFNIVQGAANFVKKIIPTLVKSENWKLLEKKNKFYEYHSKAHSAGSLVLSFISENPPEVANLITEEEFSIAERCEERPWDLTLADQISARTKALVYCWGEANGAQWTKAPNYWYMGKRCADSLPQSKKNLYVRAFRIYSEFKQDQIERIAKSGIQSAGSLLAATLQ